MTSQAYPYSLSMMSVEPVGIDFTPLVPAGNTVASAQAWIEDPSGGVTQVPSGNVGVSGLVVTVVVGPFSLLGGYKLSVLATCSQGSPTPQLPFLVSFTVAYDERQP